MWTSNLNPFVLSGIIDLLFSAYTRGCYYIGLAHPQINQSTLVSINKHSTATPHVNLTFGTIPARTPIRGSLYAIMTGQSMKRDRRGCWEDGRNENECWTCWTRRWKRTSTTSSAMPVAGTGSRWWLSKLMSIHGPSFRWSHSGGLITYLWQLWNAINPTI